MSKQLYAFPSENDADKEYNYVDRGMTLRHYFIAAAMQGFLASDHNGTIAQKDVVRLSIEHADAVLEALEKENKF